MIHAAVSQVAAELNRYLQRSFERSDEIVSISNILDQDGTLAPQIDNKVVLFVTNIAKEPAANPADRMAHIVHRDSGSRRIAAVEPLRVNVYLMFAAHFRGANYPEALKYIGSTMRFFQAKPVLDHFNTPDLDPQIDRLAFDMESLDIEQLSHLWGILSSRYLPSVLYKMRLVTIAGDEVSGRLPEIDRSETSVGT